MQLELIANLIEAMDFVQFREFARQCILQRGYKAVTSDGWSDGGRDIRVYTTEGRVSRHIAFQSSVEWNWKEKLWDDLTKAKSKLGCDDFIYITNRLIGDAVFNPLVQRALTEEEVHLNKIDKQDLASQILDTDKLRWFTEFIGLPPTDTSVTAASLRTEVTDAFVLFSDDANDFRDRIAEHTLMVALLRRGAMNERDLLSAGAEIMDFNDENRLSASLDRLQQSGEILMHGGRFELSSDMAEHYNSTQAIIAADRRGYRDSLRACLRDFLSSDADLEGAITRVEDLLGALVRRYADYQVALLLDAQGANDIRQDYVAQVLNRFS